MWNPFKTKNPTIKDDAVAYIAGGEKEFDKTYNDYINTVETVEKCVRICANIASNASMGVYREVSKELKPYKIKNIDLEYGINEVDSQPDFIRKVFSSMFLQGASIIIAEESSKSKLVSFYPYDPAAFVIEALNGEPGVYSARYAGENVTYEDNVQKMLKEMKGQDNRNAQFKTVIALNLKGRQYLFDGICEGVITNNKHGNKGFGYDPIFRPKGFKQSFAEMNLE